MCSFLRQGKLTLPRSTVLKHLFVHQTFTLLDDGFFNMKIESIIVLVDSGMEYKKLFLAPRSIMINRLTMKNIIFFKDVSQQIPSTDLM